MAAPTTSEGSSSTSKHAQAGMEPHLKGLLSDVAEQAQRLMRHWGTWSTDQRHDAVADLHDRYQDTNAALIDAVRRADFHPSPPAGPTEATQPASAGALR